jgi:hypothetical protein
MQATNDPAFVRQLLHSVDDIPGRLGKGQQHDEGHEKAATQRIAAGDDVQTSGLGILKCTASLPAAQPVGSAGKVRNANIH